MPLRINLGGEAELPDFINQQPVWGDLSVPAAATGMPLSVSLAAGEPFLFCDNLAIPLPDAIVDEIATNGVPIDISTWIGPGVQSNEVKRLLKSGGTWTDNGVLVFTKP